MSEKTIYSALRAGGLSPAGACAMMGNMWAESGLKSNNVQDNCPLGDRDYTYNVDNGIISKWQFETDAYGYGLCQWTYYTRKESLYLYAKAHGVSIADEAMQCKFCIDELAKEFADLFKYLCETDDLPKASERICAEYERPAVNNFAARINAAQKYYNSLADTCGDACNIEFPSEQQPDQTITAVVDVRILHRGDMGRDVFLLQCGLQDMGFDCGQPDGDFGAMTETAIKDMQTAKGITLSGVCDAPSWAAILQAK